jgi:RHS repeat-associated protein
MRTALRQLAICLTLCVGLSCWAASASWAAVSAGTSGSGVVSGSLAVPGVQVLDRGEQLGAQEEAVRTSAGALTAREVSRTAYEGLDAEQAGKVDAETFPSVIDDPAGGPPQLPAGQRITGFPANNAASVELGEGKHGVIESSLPIAIEGASGQRSPVNLSLTEEDGAFKVLTPLVGTGIPKHLSEGASLSEANVSLTPVSASGTPLGGSEGSIDGATVLYANSGPDTDTAIKPGTEGFSVETLLRSVNSPEKLYFRVGLPEGASLAQSQSGTGAVQILDGGDVLATVSSPGAQDAAGTSVPVSMSVSGDLLALTVGQRSGEYRYPIDVDPEVTSNAQILPWDFYNADGPEFAPSETYIGVGNNGSVPDVKGQWAYSYYITQGASQIYSFSAKTSTGGEPIVSAALYIEGKYGLEGEEELFEENGTKETQQCVELACAVPSQEHIMGRETNGVFLNATAVGNYDDPDNGWTFQDHIEASKIGIVQYVAPSVAFDTTTATVEGYPNPLYGGGQWVSAGKKWPESSAELGFEAKETGIGVDSVEWKSPTDPQWQAYYFPEFRSGPITVGKCHGVQCAECVGVICTPAEREPVTTALYGLPEGEDAVEIKASNATGESSTASAKVKIDNAPPHSITVSGISAGSEIPESEKQLKLSATATDGSGTTPSSGVAGISLAVDGTPAGSPSGGCSPGPCTASGEWTLNVENYAAGKHTLTVTATDHAGNTASEEIPFTVHRSTPVAMGPGSVDPVTGEFSLTATDVSVATSGSPMTVSRSYRSRHLSAGSEGPLGAPWNVSVSGEQSIVTTPDGNAELTNTAGQQTVFTKKGNGGFNSPSGDPNVKLSEATVKGTAALLLTSGLTVTTFEHPVSGSTSVWMPAITEGADGTDASTFAFKTVVVGEKNVTEPTEVLAPVPAGVSCSPTLSKGCRALTFTYATATTATGEGSSEWGEYAGRLSSVSFTGWNPAKKEMTTTAVADYAFDAKGRLRAEWDPQISPALKTTYGYDSESHVAALALPGEEPWLFTYGTSQADAGAGRILSVTRPAASTALGSGNAPKSTTAPSLSTSGPVMGTAVSVSNGMWSNTPLSYGYQWERCSATGTECAAIDGATNQTYTPILADNGHELLAQVTATNAVGAVPAVTTASSPVPAASPVYSSTIGSSGSGAGEFESPTSVALAPSGNVWVADPGNDRLQEFSSTGSFIEAIGWGVSSGKEELQTCTSSGRAGIWGTGAGQFANPQGVAINQSNGDIYVAEVESDRIQEFSPAGAYLAAFGSYGSEKGKLSSPYGLAIDSTGDVWVADTGNDRVEEFSSSGVFMTAFGEAGKKAGQFESDVGIALAGGDVYVTDYENNRVQEFTSSGSWVREIGTTGSEAEKIVLPEGIAMDPLDGDLYVTSWGGPEEVFTPEGKYVESFGRFGSESGEFDAPSGLAISQTTGTLYIADQDNNRVDLWAPNGPTQEPIQAPPALGTSAVTTIDYQVPVSGSGAPYAMGTKETETWGQTDLPVEATAIFPPDEPMGWPAKDYKRATVYYLDSHDRAVNVANPAGGISTTEYNAADDVVRTLSADSRKSALEAGSESAADSKLWDTESTYNGEGTQLESTLGPQHNIKWATGSGQGRLRKDYFYNEGAPSEGGPYELVTKTTTAAIVSGKEEEVRTQTNSYSGQNDLGWRLGKPTSTTTNPSSLKLVHSVAYEPKSGNVTETRLPAAGAPGEETGYSFGFQFGKSGTGSGQFKEPSGIAVNASGDTYVLDTGNNRIQEFNPEGKYLRSLGGGELERAKGIAVDSKGDVWVADTGGNRIEEYGPAGEHLAAYPSLEEEGRGENKAFNGPQGIAVDAKGDIWVADTGNSRIVVLVKEGERIYPVNEFGTAGSGETQFKEPQGIAVGAEGNLYIADTGNNRIEEYTSARKYKAVFGSEGTGTGKLKAPHSIATDAEGHVWVADTANNRIEEFSATGAFMQAFGKEGTGEGQFKEPKGIAIDAEGNAWVADTANNRVAEWTPNGSGYEASGKASAHATQTIYYTSAANTTYAACGEHPEWAGLPCQTQPAKQPESSLPKLPVKVVTYNLWEEPETSTETAGSATRTTTNTYDAAGRDLSTAISSSTGTALPTVDDEYSTTTGALTKQSTTSEGKTKSLTSTYNKLGQLESYTDASGTTATYTYDIDGRPETTNDGKGTQTYSYNATSGYLASLKDSAAGTFTATEDVEGNPVTEGYPNGMTATYTQNTAAEDIGVEYVKTTHCTTGCTWFSETVVPSIFGQQATQTNTFTTNKDTYDAAGRLTQVQETPAGGEGCTTRTYTYENDTNRTGLTTYKPGAKEECTTEGGTTEKHTYDEADRLTDAGVAYEAFGNTTTLPAADAGGAELTSSFYTDDQVATQTQNGETLGYHIDPAGRTLETVATGKTSSAIISNYMNGSESPSWTEEPSTGHWVRYIQGITGLAAVQASGATPVLRLANLHGDIIATAALSETETKPLAMTNTTEYGVPKTTAPEKYAWLGADGLSTELPTGVVAMGARSYVPQLGRLLQKDPVEGGSAAPYAYVHGDPLGETDLTGETTESGPPAWAIEGGARVAEQLVANRVAQEAAARAEAERKAAEDAAAEAAYWAYWNNYTAYWTNVMNVELSQQIGDEPSAEGGGGYGGLINPGLIDCSGGCHNTPQQEKCLKKAGDNKGQAGKCGPHGNWKEFVEVVKETTGIFKCAYEIWEAVPNCGSA